MLLRDLQDLQDLPRMKRAGILVTVLALLGAALRTQGEDFVQMSIKARDKAKAFLLSQIDPETNTFPEGERAAGILGMIAFDPFSQANSEDQKTLRQMEVQSLAVDFLQMINHILINRPGEQPLRHIDDSTLLKYLAAQRGRCLNSRDYYGHDLMAEVFRRIDGDSSLYGGMVLALCNSGQTVTKQHIQRLTEIKACETCQYRNEEVAMNLMAATCIVAQREEQDFAKDSTDTSVIPKLVNYLTKNQLADGSFSNSYLGTALAVQVLNRVPTVLPEDLDLDAATEWLTRVQRTDGSFGSSIEFTSLAVPAFTGQTPADLRLVKCPKYLTDNVKVTYIIDDTVVSRQRTRSHLVAQKGAYLLKVLSRHSYQNPYTFELRLGKSSLGVVITSVNGLNITQAATWKVYKIRSNGTEIDIQRSLDREIIREDAVYKLAYVIAVA